MAELVIPGMPDYGARELKKAAQKYLSFGLGIALAVHMALIGVYWGTVYLHKEEEPVRVIRIMKYSDLGPPPSIEASSAAVAPSVSVAGPVAKPSVGVPVPVPDADVSAEQTFATQQELSAVTSPLGGEGGGGGTGSIEDIQIEDDSPPPAFVPFEKAPTVVKKVDPDYPDMARKAGLEGTVFAHLWIDKQGHVREVKIIKSDHDVFNQPVVDAAKQWVFTPALMKNGPVAVWLAVPFRFSLN